MIRKGPAWSNSKTTRNPNSEREKKKQVRIMKAFLKVYSRALWAAPFGQRTGTLSRLEPSRTPAPILMTVDRGNFEPLFLVFLPDVLISILNVYFFKILFEANFWANLSTSAILQRRILPATSWIQILQQILITFLVFSMPGYSIPLQNLLGSTTIRVLEYLESLDKSIKHSPEGGEMEHLLREAMLFGDGVEVLEAQSKLLRQDELASRPQCKAR
ncbi:hypothetical protein C8J57DRAFT_1249519 [Mycena rebaudengoi]|nr:hypothetical protein C8J57DRAFT_1249519 [Mycena rebaudengoi]